MLCHPNSISFRVRAACAATQCSSQTELTFIVRDQSSTEITAGFCCRFHSVASEAATITSFVVRTPTALIRCRTPDFLSSTFISFSISIASMRAVCCVSIFFFERLHTHTRITGRAFDFRQSFFPLPSVEHFGSLFSTFSALFPFRFWQRKCENRKTNDFGTTTRCKCYNALYTQLYIQIDAIVGAGGGGKERIRCNRNVRALTPLTSIA